MDMVEMGAAIKRARLAKQLSQDDLCKAVGLARPTLSKLENGRLPELGMRKIMNLCERLGMEVTLQVSHGRPTLQQLRAENKLWDALDHAGVNRQRVRRTKPPVVLPEGPQ